VQDRFVELSNGSRCAALVVRLSMMIEIGGQREKLSRPVVLLGRPDAGDGFQCLFGVAGQKSQNSQADMLMDFCRGRRRRRDLATKLVYGLFHEFPPISPLSRLS